MGPRQVGKTTLARQIAAQWQSPVRHFDLENPDDQARLADPAFVLRPLTGLVVLDEIQTRPDLFPLLRILADRPDTPARFLLLGSAAPELLRHTAETLAGRVVFHELDGFALDEIAPSETDEDWLDARWLRGGFPEPCLASDAVQAERWRAQYFNDLIREDVLEFSRLHQINTMRLFVEMLRERVGSPLSLASMARDLAIAPATLKRYLDILQALFIVFTVQPWLPQYCARDFAKP